MKPYGLMVFSLGLVVSSIIAASGQTVKLQKTELSILIPSQMRFVQLTPVDLRTREEMSILSYKVLIVGSDAVTGLHWKLFVTNDRNEVVNKHDWWNRGDWKAPSLIELSTVFEYSEKSSGRLTLVLSEVVTETNLIALDSALTEQDFSKILRSNNIEGVRVDFTAHAVIPKQEQKKLITASLEAILKNQDVRRQLLLSSEPADVFFLQSAFDLRNDLKLKFVTSKQVQESIKKQVPISYFEYGGIETLGNSVRVVLNYHMPKVNGNSYIDQGLQIEASYSKVGSEYSLRGLRTVYF